MPEAPGYTDTPGVKAFPIEGPMKRERYRLGGMTDQERAWRKKWLTDQILSEHEPARLAQYHEGFLNPIRRIYRFPLDTLFRPLVPFLGYEKATMYRWFTGRFAMIFAGVWGTWYYFKYNKNTWMGKGSWRVITSKEKFVPGEEAYGQLSDRTKPSDYANRKFDSSPI